MSEKDLDLFDSMDVSPGSFGEKCLEAWERGYKRGYALGYAEALFEYGWSIDKVRQKIGEILTDDELREIQRKVSVKSV